ncbi:transposase [Nonomuraea sp. NPDC046570]|uniref:transposase n=1 Tax=Nonomuraea sp. NPDC046570 TaxID=3155255 RepID=UPI0033D143D5
MSYSIGLTLTEEVQLAVLRLPKTAWTPAHDADRQVRPGAWVAELTGWPKGMRVIARKERPHPGAQLRFTEVNGNRVTCFVTDAKHGQLADLELRHPAEPAPKTASAAPRTPAWPTCRCTTSPATRSGLVALACALLTWLQMLALPGTTARTYEPKRLRLRLFAVAGQLVRGGRRQRLRIAARWPWARDILAFNRPRQDHERSRPAATRRR